jgi:uncharacterized protein YwgA
MLTRAQSAWNKVALLAIVDASFRNGRESLDNVEIQKLSFLTELEGKSANLKAAYFRFYRDKYGPYSTALANTVAGFERLGLLHQENRELLDRGRYLLRYVRPEMERSETAQEALRVISNIARTWKDYRGWSIKDKVYELPIPVQGMGNQMLRMPEIPLYTDIIDPEVSTEREIMVFPNEIIEDICAELEIPAARLNPDSEDVWRHSLDLLNEVFAT